MKVCLAYVDAQREYVEIDRDGNGLIEYAQKLASSPGQAATDCTGRPRPASPQSPLGPLVAQARAEGYGVKGGRPRRASRSPAAAPTTATAPAS